MVSALNWAGNLGHGKSHVLFWREPRITLLVTGGAATTPSTERQLWSASAVWLTVSVGRRTSAADLHPGCMAEVVAYARSPADSPWCQLTVPGVHVAGTASVAIID